MLESKILRNELLAHHTTLRIGGPAEYFVRADSRAELIEAVQWARDKQLEIFMLGNGSNILVSDAGIRGVVIENHADQREIREKSESRERESRERGGNLEDEIRERESRERVRVIADSGASLPGLANRLARQGWRGLEWAIGVPATVGAAVVTNAGAHGGAVSDILVRAEILDSQNEISWWTREKLRYEYRASFLKAHPKEFVVLRAEFELERDDAANCIARMNQYTEHRRHTQPTEPSVGSMFKNPEGDYAGRLIEQAGLKGMRVGNVEVSRVHANFFVNVGKGTAREIRELVEIVRGRVGEKFKVGLELEIQVVGVNE